VPHEQTGKIHRTIKTAETDRSFIIPLPILNFKPREKQPRQINPWEQLLQAEKDSQGIFRKKIILFPLLFGALPRCKAWAQMKWKV
jgi:hypothetical protein